MLLLAPQNKYSSPIYNYIFDDNTTVYCYSFHPRICHFQQKKWYKNSRNLNPPQTTHSSTTLTSTNHNHPLQTSQLLSNFFFFYCSHVTSRRMSRCTRRDRKFAAKLRNASNKYKTAGDRAIRECSGSSSTSTRRNIPRRLHSPAPEYSDHDFPGLSSRGKRRYEA